jgi:hypothetical protein
MKAYASRNLKFEIKRLASRSIGFTAGAHQRGNWRDASAGLEAVVERKIFASARNPTPGVHPVASYYTA